MYIGEPLTHNSTPTCDVIDLCSDNEEFDPLPGTSAGVVERDDKERPHNQSEIIHLTPEFLQSFFECDISYTTDANSKLKTAKLPCDVAETMEFVPLPGTSTDTLVDVDQENSFNQMGTINLLIFFNLSANVTFRVH